MPKPKTTLEDRFKAVQLCLQGKSIYSVSKEFNIGNHTLERYLNSYKERGLEGLEDKAPTRYSTRMKKGVLRDYSINKLSLQEVLEKYDLCYGTFHSWQKAYGDADSLSWHLVSEIHTEQGNTIRMIMEPETKVTEKTQTMPESKEKQERRKALNKLSKKELQELLLDREAELDILKNLEALDRGRENKRHAILRGLSKD